MSGVPPVFIAAMGTPSALASIRTRLSDSGPREVKIEHRGVREPRRGAFLVDPADQPDVPLRARGVGGDCGALGAVAGDHERPVEVRLLRDLHQVRRALVGRQLAEIEGVRSGHRRRQRGGARPQVGDVHRIGDDVAAASPRAPARGRAGRRQSSC